MASNSRTLFGGESSSFTGHASVQQRPKRGPGRPPKIKKFDDPPNSAAAANYGNFIGHQQQQAEIDQSSVVLPISRIRTIMKSSPDVVQIGHESLILMTKAAEFFIEHLAQEAFNRRTVDNEVEYSALADFVQENSGGTEFLREIIPHKVKVRDLPGLTKSRTMQPNESQDDDDDDEEDS